MFLFLALFSYLIELSNYCSLCSPLRPPLSIIYLNSLMSCNTSQTGYVCRISDHLGGVMHLVVSTKHYLEPQDNIPCSENCLEPQTLAEYTPLRLCQGRGGGNTNVLYLIGLNEALVTYCVVLFGCRAKRTPLYKSVS